MIYCHCALYCFLSIVNDITYISQCKEEQGNHCVLVTQSKYLISPQLYTGKTLTHAVFTSKHTLKHEIFSYLPFFQLRTTVYFYIKNFSNNAEGCYPHLYELSNRTVKILQYKITRFCVYGWFPFCRKSVTLMGT